MKKREEKERRVKGCQDEWTDGWMDEQMDGWMDGSFSIYDCPWPSLHPSLLPHSLHTVHENSSTMSEEEKQQQVQQEQEAALAGAVEEEEEEFFEHEEGDDTLVNLGEAETPAAPASPAVDTPAPESSSTQETEPGSTSSSVPGNAENSSSSAPQPLLAPKPEGPETKLFVGQVPSQATETDLRKVFAPYGRVTHIKILTDRYTGRSKGVFAIVIITVISIIIIIIVIQVFLALGWMV